MEQREWQLLEVVVLGGVVLGHRELGLGVDEVCTDRLGRLVVRTRQREAAGEQEEAVVCYLLGTQESLSKTSLLLCRYLYVSFCHLFSISFCLSFGIFISEFLTGLSMFLIFILLTFFNVILWIFHNLVV